MNRLDAITTGYMLATSKSTLPAIGTSKRDLLTNLAIKFYQDWQVEPDTEWESLSRDVSAGTATVDNDTFDLADEINFISKDDNNYVTINGQRFQVVKFNQLSKYSTSRAVAHITVDGTHSIKFSTPFVATDTLVGQEILVPCIIKLDDLTSDKSDVLIDQANWLGERIGAQYAYSFKSLRDMYPDLLDMANETMQSMKAANSSGGESYNTEVDYFASMGNVGLDC